MRSLIWTEIKLLLPWWAVTVATSCLVLLATPASEYSDYPLMCLGLGCALLAARAFSRALTQPKQFSIERSSPSPRPSPPGRGRRFRALGISSAFGASSQRGKGEFPLLGERDRVRAVQFSGGLESTPAMVDTLSPEHACTIQMSAVSITTLAAAAVFTLISAAFRVSSGLPIPLLAVLTLSPALGIVPYFTMRTRKPFAAVVLAAFIVGLIKIASCIVVRIVYGPDALADGYMAGDWQTAKLMISLFWIGTVIVSVVSAAAWRHRCSALLTAPPPGSGLAVALSQND